MANSLEIALSCFGGFVAFGGFMLGLQYFNSQIDVFSRRRMNYCVRDYSNKDSERKYKLN